MVHQYGEFCGYTAETETILLDRHGIRLYKDKTGKHPASFRPSFDGQLATEHSIGSAANRADILP